MRDSIFASVVAYESGQVGKPSGVHELAYCKIVADVRNKGWKNLDFCKSI